MTEPTSRELQLKIDDIDRQGATEQAQLAELRSKKTELLAAGDDAAIDAVEGQIAALERHAGRRGERREVMVRDYENAIAVERDVADAEQARRVAREVDELVGELKKVLGAIRKASDRALVALNAANGDVVRMAAGALFANLTLPEKTVSEQIVSLWVFRETGVALPPEAQERVVPRPDGEGLLTVENYHGTRPVAVRRAKFRRCEYLPREIRRRSQSLQADIELIAALATYEATDRRVPVVELVAIKEDKAAALLDHDEPRQV